MGMVSRMAAVGPITAPFSPATYDAIFPPRTGAVTVTSENSLTIPAVYACTTVIAETIGSVPLQIFQNTTDGKSLARNHPLYDVLHDEPNAYQGALEFREMMTAFALLRGKGIAEKIPGPRGAVDQLKPLHPDLVWQEITQDGVLRYRYADPLLRGGTRVLLTSDVFVVRGRFGRSVIDYARVTLGSLLAMTTHQTDMYTRGTRFPGALRHPKLLDDTLRGNIRDALDEYVVGGPRSGRPLLLEDGMEWQTIGMTQEDAQFIETAQFGVSDICRFFRVQPHKIAHLINATFSNIEHQAIEFVTDTIRPWAVRWEQAIRRDLILAQALFFAEHNLDALQRGDIQARYAAYAIGRQWGWLSTNDIRRKENLNAIPGGDLDYLRPMNMTTPAGVIAYLDPAQRADVDAQLRAMVWDAAGRAVRRETERVAKWSSNGHEPDGLAELYREHARFVAGLMHLPDEDAERYAQSRYTLALGPGLPDELESKEALTALALDKADIRLTGQEEAA